MDGFNESWQPKRPSNYLREIAVRERAKALTENGLYSERVKKLNDKAVAQRRALVEQQRAESEGKKATRTKGS